MYGMTTQQQRDASQARQRRAEVDAQVERTARIAQHRADYLQSLTDGPRRPDHELAHAVARDRMATAHLDYIRARDAQREVYAGRLAAGAGAPALADAMAERIAAREALAALVGATTYDELAAELKRRGHEI